MISVVVPAYNAAATLPACLAALHQQTCPPDEIIVVDDGSTDDTAAVAWRCGVLVLQQKHQGPAAARNLGVQHARGDIILFTDADCEPAPEWIAEMVHPLSDPSVAGVKGAYCTRQHQLIARLAQCEFEERYNRLERLAAIDFIDSYAAAFRASVLRETGGFDSAFPQANNEDVDLSYRLAEGGLKLVFNRRAVVYHRHPATWGAYLRLKIKRGYWRMVVYRLHPRKALRDSYTPQLLKVQVFLLYLGGGLAVLALIWPVLAWAVIVSLGCLFLSAIPFAHRVARQDSRLAIWAPFFITGRALAFAIGTFIGIVGMAFFRPVLPRRRE